MTSSLYILRYFYRIFCREPSTVTEVKGDMQTKAIALYVWGMGPLPLYSDLCKYTIEFVILFPLQLLFVVNTFRMFITSALSHLLKSNFATKIVWLQKYKISRQM